MGNNGDISSSNTIFVPAGTLNYVIDSKYDVIMVNTSTTTVRVFLPNIKGSGLDNTSKKFFIVDNSGNAGTNNIIICPSGPNTVNGQSQLIISVNKGGAECTVGGPADYMVTGNLLPVLSGTLINQPGGFLTLDNDNAFAIVINGQTRYLQLVSKS